MDGEISTPPASVLDQFRTELESALDALDSVDSNMTVDEGHLSQTVGEEARLKDQNDLLSEREESLRKEVEVLQHRLRQEELKSRQSGQALTDLQDISGRLQAEVLEMDKDRIRCENL